MSLITPAVYKEHDPGTALGDDALQRIIDANEAYMVRVLGPHSRVGSPAVEIHNGGHAAVYPGQILGTVVSVEERYGGDPTWYLLAASDYEVLNDGRMVRRLTTGTSARSTWGPYVRLTYVPADNLSERVAALLEMVGMDVTAGVSSGGLQSRTMGSWSETYGQGETGREAAKAKVLARLSPTGGFTFA
jgi:hypothetical protein